MGGAMSGLVKRRVNPKYVNEFPEYAKQNPFDTKKIIVKGILKDKNFAQVVSGKKGEIIFVKKMDGTTVLGAREYNDTFPHPVLSKGEDVVATGLIEPVFDNQGMLGGIPMIECITHIKKSIWIMTIPLVLVMKNCLNNMRKYLIN